jgi:hypothetical protein
MWSTGSNHVAITKHNLLALICYLTSEYNPFQMTRKILWIKWWHVNLMDRQVNT